MEKTDGWHELGHPEGVALSRPPAVSSGKNSNRSSSAAVASRSSCIPRGMRPVPTDPFVACDQNMAMMATLVTATGERLGLDETV